MCPVFFSKETSCVSILVRDHLPKEITKSLHFGWSLSGGSTVVSFSSSAAVSVGPCFGSWVARIHLQTKALPHYILKSTNIILYYEGKRPLGSFCGKDVRIRFGGEKPLDCLNYDGLAVS